MASTTTDANTPKTGAVKRWDGNAERDLCLAIIMGGSTDGDKFRPDWNTTHSAMTALGYDFTKDAMSQRWSKTIMKEFKSRHSDADLASPASSPTKMTPTKRKKAAAAAAAAATTTSDEAASDSGAVEETVVAAATPPATPKGRKRAPAKPKATGPPKSRGRKPKSATTVKSEEEEDGEPTPAKAAVEKPATAKKGPVTNAKSEDAEKAPEDQPSPSKKAKVEPQEDTEMTDDV
ncbi:hypothetical protein MY4038_005507 [Beauveria bassiana]